MRTNIDIDDDLLAEAMRLAGTTTKKSTVEEALRALIRRHKIETLRSLRGRVAWEGDLDEMREDHHADALTAQ